MISIIVAVGENNQIGKDNQLLWHLKDDLQFFKKTTKNKAIIMGRKTFDSIGRPLPHRKNIILTSQNNLKVENCFVYNNLEDCIESAKKFSEEIFIIGGASLYEAGMNIADRIYLTKVNYNGDADVFFPKIDFSLWNKDLLFSKKKDENNNYDFKTYLLDRK